MSKTVEADDRGRITIPHEIRERYGDRYRIVELNDRVELIPLQDDPIENEGELYTSRATLLELLMISDRFEFDRMEVLSYALEIAAVPEDETILFQAADYMEQHGLTAFDSYHVAYADEDSIVSSDKSFDDATNDRISIEERE